MGGITKQNYTQSHDGEYTSNRAYGIVLPVHQQFANNSPREPNGPLATFAKHG